MIELRSQAREWAIVGGVYIVRTSDPSPRIASRLVVSVSLSRIDITPEAIRISARR